MSKSVRLSKSTGSHQRNGKSGKRYCLLINVFSICNIWQMCVTMWTMIYAYIKSHAQISFVKLSILCHLNIFKARLYFFHGLYTVII
jgi:hypothetical protein